MRVLHIGLAANRGGTESFVYNYMDSLKDKDIIFDFVDIYGKGLAEELWLKEKGAKIYKLKNYKKHPVSVYRSIREIIRTNRYKVVHIHMQSAANLLPVYAAINSGVIPILHSHNTSAVGMIRSILHDMNCKKLRNIKAYHLACGEDAGKWMWGSNQYRVVPNAISIKKYHYSEEWRNSIRKELGVAVDTNVVGYVGRITYEKNPYYFIKLMNRMLERKIDNTIFLLVGNGDMFDEIKNVIRNEKLENRIIMYGESENVNKIYSAMDCFALPSLFEGLPFVGIEAQASGLPVIFSENVARELDLSDKVKHLKLSDIDLWIDVIEKYCATSKETREPIQEIFKKSVYNITNSALELEKIYERKK